MIAEPRLAATLLALRQAASNFETLMIVRRKEMQFAGGALVFPGGALDEQDRSFAASLREEHPELHPDDLALRIAAIRETFEESGLLLARTLRGEPVPDDVKCSLLKLRSDPSEWDFMNAMRLYGLSLLISDLVPFARWITPDIRPKRFDTHFFVVAASSSIHHDGQEAVEALWIKPEQALESAEQGMFKLVFATRMNLNRLVSFSSADKVLEKFRNTPIVPVCPEYVEMPEGRHIRIPTEAGYGGSLFPAIDPPSM